ncbi:LysR family transcriptional regulator [Salinicoccus sp. ID82-1]|uniref:LysR family transcriptional regulator n=1 Tax=Salinicoccus cyprini TaxID=2493691 RepID=A0A558ASU7_9STAP|nr:MULTISPECIES: LysR family transcriptional regulator [Salinicoccus]MCG1009802.1 LysR family transcriptional regulator [Salinicoccus sp. ID82-1]TVT27330.1 LysR family transcriptional regulator [Salinicoccus cyprini]
MEIKQLKYFIETARQEHMTEAALSLNVAQSALSRQINMLEGDLGVKLFNRVGRNIKLTDAGKLFYEDAVSIIDAVERSKEKINEENILKKYTLNIHITRSDMTSKVLQSLNQFLKQNEEVEFAIHTLDEASVEEKLLDETLDIVISANRADHHNIQSALLFEQNYYYVFRESNSVQLPTRASFNELEEFPLVTYDPVFDSSQLFRREDIGTYKDMTIIQHLLIDHGHVAILTREETKQLTYSYPNFTVHSLNHLNIKHPMYVSMRKDNQKTFVKRWYNQLHQSFSPLFQPYSD